MTIKAVVFDMDGLLVDSEPLWQRARIEAFGADRLRWTDEDQTRVMGSSTRGWATYVAERLEHAYSVDEVIVRVVDQMEQFYRTEVPLLPGARQAVESLQGLYPLGLASGSPTQLIRAVFDGAGWQKVFSEIISTDDLRRGKPAPDVYLEITRRMGINPSNTAIFEDSANGILSGYEAGTKVIAVPSSYLRPPQDALNKASLVLESLLDFSPELLRDL